MRQGHRGGGIMARQQSLAGLLPILLAVFFILAASLSPAAEQSRYLTMSKAVLSQAMDHAKDAMSNMTIGPEMSRMVTAIPSMLRTGFGGGEAGGGTTGGGAGGNYYDGHHDGVWELRGRVGAFREGASSNMSLNEAGLESQSRRRLRERVFARSSSPEAPWGGLANHLEDPPACNPTECGCAAHFANRTVCDEVHHRQKPLLHVATDQGTHGEYDCPSVRCIVSAAANYSSRDRAFFTMLKYGGLRTFASFPKKVDPHRSKNVLIIAESSGRFRELGDPGFYKRAGVDITWAFTPMGGLPNIPNGFGGEPPIFYRSRGPSFGERSNRTAFFTSNCRGAVAQWRYHYLDKMTQHMKLDSFRRSQCLWHNATQANMATDWPRCLRSDLPSSRKDPRAEYRMYREKECVLRHSRMTVIVENSREKGYMTEKILQALRQGAVPIYHGALNVKELLPHPNAAVLTEDFESVQAAMEYANKVNHDEQLWLRHTAWKSLPFSPGFASLLAASAGPCVLCEYFARPSAEAAFTMPPPAPSNISCLEEALRASLGPSHSLPVLPALSPSGVDAIFILPGAQSLQLQADFRAIWGADSTIITVLDQGAHRGCFEGALQCQAGFCPAEGAGVCGQHLFSAYLTVRYALSNVLVLRGDASLAGGVQGWSQSPRQGEWARLLRELPDGYHAAAVGGGCGRGGGVAEAGLKGGVAEAGLKGGVAEASLCPGGYLLSQAGARKWLGGGKMELYRGAAGATFVMHGGACGR